jgi:hypothetical protein
VRSPAAATRTAGASDPDSASSAGSFRSGTSPADRRRLGTRCAASRGSRAGVVSGAWRWSRGVVLHGSLALGGYLPGRSDIDLLVVVDDRLTPIQVPSLAEAGGQERPRAPVRVDLHAVNTRGRCRPDAFAGIKERVDSAELGPVVSQSAVLKRVPPGSEPDDRLGGANVADLGSRCRTRSTSLTVRPRAWSPTGSCRSRCRRSPTSARHVRECPSRTFAARR